MDSKKQEPILVPRRSSLFTALLWAAEDAIQALADAVVPAMAQRVEKLKHRRSGRQHRASTIPAKVSTLYPRSPTAARRWSR